MAGGVGWLAIMTAIHRTPTFEWLIFLMGINGINGIHAGVLFHSLVVGGICGCFQKYGYSQIIPFPL